ncbi:MFS transporter [Streptomyces sp. NPDC018693]|uniref:MFS transporter n=1 Tax=unclassified Streptomyces TaxID=2593676 RepID=UPI0037A925FB
MDDDTPPVPTQPRARPGRRPFAVLTTVHLTLNASVSVTFAAGPAMQRELHLTRTDLVLDSAAYGLAFSGLLLLGGRLTDRHGRRPVFTLGTTLFATASLAAALAPASAPWTLVAARFLQGCGAALAAPAAMALLRTVFPDGRSRASATALWGLLASLGASLGILLSGALVTWASWRWSFALLAAAAALALTVTNRLLPHGPPPRPVPVDMLGALLGTTALTLLGCGCALASPYGWSSAPVLALLTGGALLLTAFAAAERRAQAPLLPLGFLASRTRATALLCALFAPGAGAATAFLLALYLQQTRAYSALRNAEAFLPYTAVLLAVGSVAGALVARRGPRTVAVGGTATIAAGLYLIGGLGIRTASTPAVLLGLVVVAAGIGLLMSAAVVAAVAGAADSETALAGALVNAAILAGPTLSVALVTSAAHSRTTTATASPTPDGYAFAFETLAAAATLVCAAAAHGLRPTPTPEPKPDTNPAQATKLSTSPGPSTR